MLLVPGCSSTEDGEDAGALQQGQL